MHGNAENISSAISNAASSKIGVGSTLVAGGMIITAKDPETFGRFLATHGPEFLGYQSLLSWSECFTTCGAIFVTYQLGKVTISITKDLIVALKKFYKFCRGFKRRPIQIKPKGASHAANSKS